MTVVTQPKHAVILAAGMGRRIGPVFPNTPKGLIELNGETLVGRSLRLLRDAGITQVTMVVGYQANRYREFAATHDDVRLVINDRYETTGSMASLAVALEDVRQDMLVLESDIIYEPRALTAILSAAAPDATLMSGPTGADDEVWVYAPDSRMVAMSKDVRELEALHGEFVGITRLSPNAATAMLNAFKGFVEIHGHARVDYETDALVAVARLFPVSTVHVPDLCWGEIDDERQLERVLHKVLPVLNAKSPVVT